MELRHLRYFVAVAEELHFGRAALRLNIAQPPLSQQIRQLESELGVELLSRTTRRVDLTPAGERYLARTRAVLAEVEAAGDEAVRIAAGQVGRVALGFVESATYELLPALTRVLRQDFPELDVQVKGEMLVPTQVAALLDRTLDIAFLRPPVREPRLDVEVVRREPLIAVLPAHHRLATRPRVRLADLRDEPFVTHLSHGRSVMYDAVLDACHEAGFTPSSMTEVGETSTLVSFVAAGLGVALVPASVQHLTITGAEFRPLAGAAREVELAVAVRAGEDAPHITRVLARTHAFLRHRPSAPDLAR